MSVKTSKMKKTPPKLRNVKMEHEEEEGRCSSKGDLNFVVISPYIHIFTKVLL